MTRCMVDDVVVTYVGQLQCLEERSRVWLRFLEDTLSESERNLVDVRKTDVNIQQPEKLSYADIVKKRTQRKRPESDTESAEATRITFRK